MRDFMFLLPSSGEPAKNRPPRWASFGPTTASRASRERASAAFALPALPALPALAALAAVLALAAACGADPAERTRADDDAPPPAETSEGAPPAERPSQTAGETAAGAAAREPPDGWTRGPLRGSGTTDSVAVLEAVRFARHDGYDRIVLEFAGGLPSWTVESAGAVVACGSGERVTLRGTSTLEVRTEPARAHTEAGEPTVRGRAWTPELPVLRELRITCDFEAHVDLAAGLAGAAEFRALTLARPHRLVVDVRHGRENP